MRIAQLIIKNFSAAKAPLTTIELSHILEIPVRLLRDILYELVQSGVISEVKNQDSQETSFQPAKDPHLLTIKSVIDALENKGVDNIPVARSAELQAISEKLQKLAAIFEKSADNKLLKDIV